MRELLDRAKAPHQPARVDSRLVPDVWVEPEYVVTVLADSGKDSYVAAFNISDRAQTVHYAWSDLGLAAPSYKLRDLWKRAEMGSAASLEITLPPHASVLYRAVPDHR